MSAMAQQRYREKMAVEVKRRDFAGSGSPQWKSGLVKEVAGKGCFVVVNGNSSFYPWNDIRPVQREELPKPAPMKAPLTAFARVTDLHDFVKKEPELPVMEPRGFITQPEDQPRLLPARASKLKKPHRVTRCGEVFRRVRLAKTMTQEVLASALGIPNQYVSRIELGDTLPTDEHLLRFSEWSGYDLADLELKRDADAKQLRVALPVSRLAPQPTPVYAQPAEPAMAPDPPAIKVPMEVPLRPAPPPAPLVDPLAQPFSAATDFVDFLQGLKRLVPCPKAADQRTAWMTAAEQLWELSQKS